VITDKPCLWERPFKARVSDSMDSFSVVPPSAGTVFKANSQREVVTYCCFACEGSEGSDRIEIFDGDAGPM